MTQVEIAHSIDENTGMFRVETRGNLKFMPRNAQEVRAIYGYFYRSEVSTLVYEAWNIGDDEYTDDYYALKSGDVDIEEYRCN